MTDALAAIVDDELHPPRQGDGDDGYGLIVDGAGVDRWAALLNTGDAVFGRCTWWPAVPAADVRTPLLAALLGRPALPDVRPVTRPEHFADAGMTVLRADGVWCRCDAGPHGFGSIAAHAHADALSVEVRHRGVDILADPGTYCYHGEPQWRSYFRSTRAHNTLELDGTDQSASGGPFLWTRHARSRVLDHGHSRWQAEHHGYAPAAVHRRTVELDGPLVRIVDEIHGAASREGVLSFHLGPQVDVVLDGPSARLRWAGGSADLALPTSLCWTAHRGETSPPLGWYSPGFGRKQPAVTLVGRGLITSSEALLTTLRFDPSAAPEERS
jgi:hypothetical protein